MFKYSGVIFDEHQSLNEHVKAIVSKAGRRVGMLDRACRCITLHSAANAILQCCAGAWECCEEVKRATLEALQKRIIRIAILISYCCVFCVR